MEMEPDTPISSRLKDRVQIAEETARGGGPLSARLHEDQGFGWVDMVHIAGPQVAEERLKSYWTSIGVTSALTGSMAFAGIYTGPVEHYGADKTPSVIIELYAIAMGLSFVTSLTAVICSTLLHSRLNALPRP